VDKDFFAFVKNLVGEEVLAEFQRDYGKYYEEMRKNWIEIKESESEFTEDESVKVSSKFLTLLEKYKPGKVVFRLKVFKNWQKILIVILELNCHPKTFMESFKEL
jgi:hypothetical protein